MGPPDRTCLSGAWSTDGKWIYLAATTDKSHIWRQGFPDGEPEQITFGPTSQQGIAIAPDGKSFITSVGSRDSTVWVHDKVGDHQISSEGNTAAPLFSSDGKSLYFLLENGQTGNDELWVEDLARGKMERLLPGYSMDQYSVSRDGKQAVFVMTDEHNHPSLWIAPTNRRSSPVRLSTSTIDDSPFFLPGGDVVFRAVEGGSNFLYRMKPDGTERRKITSERILDVNVLSPDGRWLVAGSPVSDRENMVATKAYPVNGGEAVSLCLGYCMPSWDIAGKFMFVNFPSVFEGTYALPVLPDSGLPKLPSTGIANIDDFKNAKTATVIPTFVNSALSPSVYAFTRQNIRRNLYRIPLP